MTITATKMAFIGGLFSLVAYAGSPQAGTKILWDVPLIRQSTDYSCGAASLQAVMGYYGQDFMETEVMKGAGTNKNIGTAIEKIARFAQKNGIGAQVRADLTLSDLEQSIANENPVLVEMQAWPDNPVTNYPEVFTEGHDVVVIGLDSLNVYFMDPSILGGRGFIPRDQFLDRWHIIATSGENAYHTGILFHALKKPPATWLFIE